MNGSYKPKKARPSSSKFAWLILAVGAGLFLMIAVIFPFLAAAPAYAQPQNGISQPAEGDILAGIVIVEGTATHPQFMRYEVAFYQEFNPGAGWIVFSTGDQPVIDGALAVWDTTVGQNVNAPVFPDGNYRLRLRVVRADYNYDEYFVTGLTISNQTSTPTPTITVTVTAAPDEVDEDPAIAPTPLPGVAPLPTLTPFPTPSPRATPLPEIGGPIRTEPVPDGERQGVFAQLAAVDTAQFGGAFWLGVRITFLIFLGMAAYLLFRKALRYIWRMVLLKWF